MLTTRRIASPRIATPSASSAPSAPSTRVTPPGATRLLRRGVLAVSVVSLALGALTACGSSGGTTTASSSGGATTAMSAAATSSAMSSVSMSSPAPATTAAKPPTSASVKAPVAKAPAATAMIMIKSFKYQVPASVRPGATVSVMNMDGQAHTVTADKASAFDDQATAGKTTTFKAPMTPGSYPFHCTYHSNMHGVLVVK